MLNFSRIPVPVTFPPKKVREEQLRVRPDIHAPIDNDTLERMDYTRRVVKELLRCVGWERVSTWNLLEFI